MYFEARNLHIQFDSIRINADFSCEKGTMTCILGPSGSGKSTVLRMIAGLEKCPDAKIELNGKDISRESIRNRGIGMVFQSASLFDHMSVEDNVAYGLVCHGMSKKEGRKQAAEFLEIFNLKDFGKRRPETLSGGEAQRVSLARTLIVKPELVLFDEPLSALDAPLRKKLALEIKNLQQTFGFTGIMVTHDIQEAKALAHTIILMKAGKIIWQGPAVDFDESLMN